MANKTTTALQKSEPKTLKDNLNSPAFRSEVAKALPKHCTIDRQIRAMLTAVTRTPTLLECDQASFFAACLTLSQLGLEPDGRRAHLIPYGKTVQLIVDYKGIVELVMRSGVVSYIHADVVCEGDDFVYNRGCLEKHTIDFKQDRGAMYAVYALCKFKDGTEKCEVMTKSEVDAIRKRSKASGSGPWVSDYNEMAKKTVFRRLSKWLPFSPEQRDMIEADDELAPAIPIQSTVTTDAKRPVHNDNPMEITYDPDPVVPSADPASNKIVALETDDFPTLLKKIGQLMSASEVNIDSLMGYLVKIKMAKPEQILDELAESKLAQIVNTWDTLVVEVKKG